MRIAVIGDVMLDMQIACTERENLEGAEICLTGEEFTYHPGGAANVAVLLEAMGAEVRLLGAVGDDWAADRLCALLEPMSYSLSRTSRPTTVKLRATVGDENRTRVRVDREKVDPISDTTADVLVASIGFPPGCTPPEHSAIVLADYGKGVFFGDEVKDLIDGTTCPLICSPYPTGRHDIWGGASVATMNEHEWPVIGDVGAEWTVVTRGPQGADIYYGTTSYGHAGGIRAVKDPQRVGAGDAVVARLAYLLAGETSVPAATKAAVEYATHYVRRRRGE
jgi:D-beta-D-heptose 7-phosphate kinase/D-beta-D-heptose 1-phosphate adenosyltransferase